MTYRGTVKDGVVVLAEGVKLPEGKAVAVEVLEENTETIPTLYERLKSVMGKAQGLPEDMADNHDHYIHGAPKGIDKP